MWTVDWLSREDKIKRIYDVVWTVKSQRNELAVFAAMKVGMNKSWPVLQSICSKFEELCWPKVMIGDVLDWFWHNRSEILCLSKEYKPHYNLVNLFIFWGKKREAIEEQSDNCVDYVYSLLEA